jgi:lipopolysaccharide transport system ATP-binding protein
MRPGEAVAVIGRNGAGKSTLLKILSRVTPPTEGRISLRGRLASLLEVGTGFHTELTGRENIFLNGAILGMSRTEIRKKFDEIVSFSGVDQFLDTPVKRYSSGMFVRLAFAVAAHLEPEVLLVDEVLSVGDADFQKKCLGRMGEVARGGRTVLLVSHNMQAVRSLCERALLIEAGRCVMDGPTQDVIREYLSAGGEPGSGEREWKDPDDRPGDENVRLRAMRLRTEAGQVIDQFESGRPVTVEMEFEVLKEHPDLTVGFDLLKDDGVVVLRSLQNDVEGAVTLRPGINVLRAVIPGGLLNAGRLGVAPRISIFRKKWIVQSGPAVEFDLVFTHGRSTYMEYFDRWRNGLIAPILEWTAVRPEAR